jgi:hypothetical protein
MLRQNMRHDAEAVTIIFDVTIIAAIGYVKMISDKIRCKKLAPEEVYQVY